MINSNPNAWIFLNEDEPPGTNYNSPSSCFQSLIINKVYNSLNFLGIAFFEVVPDTQGFTIQIGNGCHPGDPSNPNKLLSNQDYLKKILADARAVNPNIKFLATMVYSGNQTLAAIFSSGDPQTQATTFANNLVQYLKANGMNGLDVDFEDVVAERMSQTQFQILFSTVRNVFDRQPEKYYLTMAPAWPNSTYDIHTLNSAFDFISPQFYDGTNLSQFLEAGIAPAKIGYGAQFEPGNAAPNSSAQQVWNAVSGGFTYKDTLYPYQDIFVWRLNSGNFQFEQAQIMILSELTNPPAGVSFDDTAIVATAGNPNMTQMIIQSGDILNAIQSINTGTGPYNTGTQNTGTGVFTLVQHGGTSGTSHTVNIPAGDPIVSISGYTGTWHGWNCVLQLTLTSKAGIQYGPFGSMAGATSQTPFIQTGKPGQTVVAFSGTTITVPLAGGGQTAIIASLNAVFT